MAKSGPKMAEINLGVSHMISDNILNFFLFFNFFSFAFFLDPVFRVISFKFCQNSGFLKYQKEKVGKQKMLKMLSFIICETPKLISAIFGPF